MSHPQCEIDLPFRRRALCFYSGMKVVAIESETQSDMSHPLGSSTGLSSGFLAHGSLPGTPCSDRVASVSFERCSSSRSSICDEDDETKSQDNSENELAVVAGETLTVNIKGLFGASPMTSSGRHVEGNPLENSQAPTSASQGFSSQVIHVATASSTDPSHDDVGLLEQAKPSKVRFEHSSSRKLHVVSINVDGCEEDSQYPLLRTWHPEAPFIGAESPVPDEPVARSRLMNSPKDAQTTRSGHTTGAGVKRALRFGEEDVSRGPRSGHDPLKQFCRVVNQFSEEEAEDTEEVVEET